MTMRHGFYFHAVKERFGFRAVLICYDNGMKLWSERQGLPLTTREDALSNAESWARYRCQQYNPQPKVAAFTVAS